MLSTINQFLNNSKDKREKVGDLVNQIRDVAQEAEDIIEMFIVNMAKHKMRGTVDKFLHGLQHTWTLRSVATDIERLQNQIATIYQNKEFYGIQDDKETVDDSVRRRSWELLARKAFWGKRCPKELEKDGRRIAEKCKGLPLSLVVAGALLAQREKSTRVWSKLAENVNWYLNDDGEKCLDILALSYEELPPKLKSCFLYFGVFPEDFQIPVRQLIRLWMAEGFVKDERNMKAEDIADEYLEDLVDRSLIIARDERSDGGIKSCSIHDVLREFCIEKGLQENFFVHSGTSTSLDTTTKPRRLSINRKISEHISSKVYDSSRVRSLLYFGHLNKVNGKILNSIVKDFPLLRVFDLGITSFPENLSSFGQLILLRYVKLYAPGLREIPPPICRLPNLQTLDLSNSIIVSFQPNFWDMQQLRHLFISGILSCHVRGAKPMPNLQTFSTVSSKILSHVDVSEVFPNLTNLGVRCSSDIDVFGKLHDVTSIKIIKIIGELAAQPIKGDGFLSNLTKITLVGTKLEQSQFAKLGELPNLEALKLLKGSMNDGSHLECNEGCFPRLQVLHVQRTKVNWNIKSGAFKNLLHLKSDSLGLPSDQHWAFFDSRGVRLTNMATYRILRCFGKSIKVNLPK
ncbi:hypothetical protein LguiB_032223 [Lonicera macranthoides]